ncbi:helix-turn-helix domain-containing protein [Thioclava indica]|uniref:helix-turn-helix transcriptional regulator n=1 Tax=Thioclava indica TaxID=1353528 RepID=UPI00056FE3D0
MLTSWQIRGARASLGWSANELAGKCGISRRTIVSIESADGIPSTGTHTLAKIQTALEAAGIEFVTAFDGAPGIFLRQPE